MEQLVTYFENIPTLHRSLILVGGITFFWILEGIVPLFNVPYRKWHHSVPNFFFTLTTIIVNFPLAFLLLKTSDWAMSNDFGIINWLPEMPLWLYVFLGVMLLDLIGAYTAHWVEHKVKPLWMVHLVHHSDHNVDTTTANRHHPLESLIRYTFTLIGVFVVGAPIGIIMLYQSLSVVLSQFNHANIRLPKTVDNAISWIIVSPDMHKVHHHYKLPYTDSNYGNIFSIWDRLFGTYMTMDMTKIVYGVDTFPDEKENSSIVGLLKQPFHKYRKPTTEKNET
ncbi:sterol desaturase family protein [Flagellimonas pacifica]|uniref:Fatty acid hydroxylase superfamily protein n=1 Tax=Flagellimonas pacifica TaxID=1247520 RepID=A0A285MWS4_9FLAO|nr:sterol desaturase family protein [Allomuricauda parva]SNZ01650.1 Fatty acid hydroxylase superfamily protein [Allomuricauda parva]